MYLAAQTGSAVEIRIAAYQFPDDHTSEYDSNWLVIEGHVSHPRGKWAFRDSCLLTYEAEKLGNWLEALVRGTEMDPEIGFIEPNLSFAVVSAEGIQILRVLFALESRPTWAAWNEKVAVDFSVAETDIAGAVMAWREELRKFPQRAER